MSALSPECTSVLGSFFTVLWFKNAALSFVKNFSQSGTVHINVQINTKHRSVCLHKNPLVLFNTTLHITYVEPEKF